MHEHSEIIFFIESEDSENKWFLKPQTSSPNIYLDDNDFQNHIQWNIPRWRRAPSSEKKIVTVSISKHLNLNANKPHKKRT